MSSSYIAARPSRVIGIAASIFLVVMMTSNPLFADDPCAPHGGVSFLCGPTNAEDLVQIPGTNWIVASGMADNSTPGHLYLIDSEKKAWEIFFPGDNPRRELNSLEFGECPGAISTESFAPHGLSIVSRNQDHSRLYITSHGSREAIEIFDIYLSGSRPDITWIGCVPLPEGIFANSVAILPNGGFVTTKMFDPTKDNSFDEAVSGLITGSVYEWNKEAGITELVDSELSGGNGIAVSADGMSIFATGWGGRNLIRISRDSGQIRRREITLDFMPDNLRWAPDGTLLLAGQRPHPTERCGSTPCPEGWEIHRIDPNSLETIVIKTQDASSPMQGISSALEMNGEIWIGTFRGDRIGLIPAN